MTVFGCAWLCMLQLMPTHMYVHSNRQYEYALRGWRPRTSGLGMQLAALLGQGQGPQKELAGLWGLGIFFF